MRESGAVHAPSTELQRLARRHRSDGLGRSLAAAWRYAIGKASQAVAAWEHQRDARAIYRALRELHPRTLHDLGIDRRELRSVAAEAAGTAAATRLRLDRALRGLY